jgi:hypothetical protein
MEIRSQITAWDIVGVIADIQTSFTENYKKLESKYEWRLSDDARLQVIFNCGDLANSTNLLEQKN